jgi:hypothetical protein
MDWLKQLLSNRAALFLIVLSLLIGASVLLVFYNIVGKM